MILKLRNQIKLKTSMFDNVLEKVNQFLGRKEDIFELRGIHEYIWKGFRWNADAFLSFSYRRAIIEKGIFLQVKRRLGEVDTCLSLNR